MILFLAGSIVTVIQDVDVRFPLLSWRSDINLEGLQCIVPPVMQEGMLELPPVFLLAPTICPLSLMP